MNDPRTQFPPTFNHNFENPFAHTPPASRLSQTSGRSCTNTYNNDHKSLQFSHHQETDDSGVCSPPLWKNSPSPSHPLLHRLSPNSRIEAITNGQRELMDMVKNMPESSYELSLKDLVEINQRQQQTPDGNKRVVVKVKRQESNKQQGVTRIESFENKRVFLKMVIPFSLKSTPANKKTKFVMSNSSGKVSPDKDWYWKKKLTASTHSNNSSSSTSNNSAHAHRRINGYLTGCWPFLQSRSSKSID